MKRLIVRIRRKLRFYIFKLVCLVIECTHPLDEEKIGGKIVLKALEEPAKQIAVNAGLEPAVIVEKVKQSEKGLTISLENIQFEPDSNKLLPQEKKKLEKKL